MPLALSAAVFVVLLCWGALANFVQYKSDCPAGSCFFHVGETFSAIYTAIYYQVHGAEFWFLQELPLHIDQPNFFNLETIIYPHNMNIGGFIVYAVSLLGGKSIVAPAIFTMVAYSTGIFYAYKFAEASAGSRLLASWFAFL